MRKFFGVIAALVLAFSIAPHMASAQSVNNFTIDKFEADYYLTKDQEGVSQLKVVEKITAKFPDFNQNHGIERAIPKVYRNNQLKLNVVSVTDENKKEWDYSTRTDNDNAVLRIGDAKKYVQGLQTYVITYTLQDVITFESNSGQVYGYDELFWDVNGTEWQQQFQSITARVHVDNTLASKLNKELEPRCYTGSYASDESACTFTKTEDETTTIFEFSALRPLSNGENLSFVLGFQSGTFVKYQASLLSTLGPIAAAVAVLIISPLLALFIMLRRWRRSGHDPKGRGVIVAQYSVPKDMNPVLADIILNENLQTKSISATLISLAVKGYVKLYEEEKKNLLGSSQEYVVELLKQTDDLSPEEQTVASMIFPNPSVGQRVNLDEMKNKLYKEVKPLATAASQRVVNAGYFEVSPEVARKKYTGWGIALLVIGFVPLFIFPPALIGSIGLGIAGIIVLVIGNAMPKRTPKGVETKDYLKGLGVYMKLAEAERIKYLQAPDTVEKIDTNDNTQVIKLYEKLLPYAILFGIEKDWAKQFADLYQGGESPTWYSGNSAFNAVVFSNAISGFNASTASSFSAPSSSGSSGFSGGGFSGGGGGGGGGGGW